MQGSLSPRAPDYAYLFPVVNTRFRLVAEGFTVCIGMRDLFIGRLLSRPHRGGQ